MYGRVSVDRAVGLSVRAVCEARRVSGASHFVREGAVSVWWRAKKTSYCLELKASVFPT